MFQGFSSHQPSVGGVLVNCVVGGNGPPLLLLHGYPQTHAMWARVAPLLAESFTVVCPDLRGYGDSSKPPAMPDCANYTFRAMAADQVGLMRQLGFERFSVAGHDRGGRVAHRMTLDWPDLVDKLVLLDIVPTLFMYDQTDRAFASTFWLWFFLPLPSPFPERLIGADPDFFYEACLGRYGGTGLESFDSEALAEYRRCWREPAMIHASCADYRAGASLDLVHDRADLNTKIACPTLVLQAADGLMAKQFNFDGIWADRCVNLTSAQIPGGHFFPDHRPVETAAALRRFVGET